ncbi:MAG: sodium:solute symporter family transporter [Rubrobacter sp.]
MQSNFWWIGAIPAMVFIALFMILPGGINMYAMPIVFQLLLGWSITASILLSAGITMVYITMGGLSSSIYNEVL